MNRKLSERLCAVLLAALMVCTMIPFAVSADDNVLDGTDATTLTPGDVLEDTVEPDTTEDVIDDIAKPDVTEDAPDEQLDDNELPIIPIEPETDDKDDTHEHTLTAVEAKDADCTKEGNIAYYVCGVCQKYFTDEKAENEITDKSSVILAKTDHNWAPATCEAPETCRTCGATQGSSLGGHVYGNAKKSTEYHWFECVKCGETSESGSHTFENGVCTICGMDEGHNCEEHLVFFSHLETEKSDAISENGHHAICSVCNDYYRARNKTYPHTYDANGYCTVCGYKNHEHTMRYKQTVDFSHYAVCEDCGYIERQYHTLDSHNICTVCGYKSCEHKYEVSEKRGNSHDLICSLCGYTNNYIQHTYENGVCTVCGLAEHNCADHLTAFKTNGPDKHDIVCSICGDNYGWRTADHNFGKDGKCVDCGMEKHVCKEHAVPTATTPWQQAHFAECSICGAQINDDGYYYGFHTMKDGECTVCGYKDHQHTYEYVCKTGSDPFTGASGFGHYQRCTDCGVIIALLNHEFNESGVCEDCGFAIGHTYVYDPETCKTDSSTHETRCITCGELSKLPVQHTFGSDGKCTVCGYSENTPSIPDGLNKVDGVWKYYKDGEVDTSYTGAVRYNGGIFYVTNGIMDTNYAGLVKFENAWLYISGGRFNGAFNGAIRYNGGIFYVTNGVMNWSYTGLTKFENAWIYVKNSRFDGTFTNAIRYNGGIFYITKGVLNWSYTGLTKFENAWIYITKSKFDGAFNGLVNYNGGLFYITKGVLNWSYTGMAKYNNTWYYIVNSKRSFYNGTVKQNGVTYTVKNGIATSWR